MKIAFSSLMLLLLTGTSSVARLQQPAQSQQPCVGGCGFTVQGEPARPIISGPDDVVPLVHVLEQPDSPVEVVSVDLEGMWLSASNGQYAEQDCLRYTVRNRSDQVVQGFGVELMVSGTDGSNGTTVMSDSRLAPGETYVIKSCGNGTGGVSGNQVRMMVFIHSVDFESYIYKPSLKIPRSLGVQAVW